eukprot:PhM_4_TR7007/c0_g1_i1/m.39544/K03872/TCEB1; transcription elongation factor B, polypeptide 1
MYRQRPVRAPSKENENAVPDTFDPNGLVKLVSRDGHVFHVDQTCAKVSRLLKAALEGASREGVRIEDDRFVLEEIPAAVLEKAIQYFYYKVRYDHDPDNRPDFIVAPTMALDLMLAAKQLQC